MRRVARPAAKILSKPRCNHALVEQGVDDSAGKPNPELKMFATETLPSCDG